MDKNQQESNLYSIKENLDQITADNGDNSSSPRIQLNPAKINAKIADLLDRSRNNRARLDEIGKECGRNGEVWGRYQNCLDDLLAKIGENRINFDLAMAKSADTDPERLKTAKLKLEVNYILYVEVVQKK